MFPSKLFSNDSLPTLQNSFLSLNSISSCTFGPTTTRLELYPRRRHTEFYYEPQPMEEYQSRVGEHPHDKLQKQRDSKFELETIDEETPKLRINPPKNSDMRMFRDSYFS